jgi:predicted DNA-binding transcriptional regulator AlpA
VSTETAADPLFIPAKKLAAMMNISTRTLWRKLSAKKIPEPVRIGGLPRWRLDQVREWINQGCPATNGER